MKPNHWRFAQYSAKYFEHHLIYQNADIQGSLRGTLSSHCAQIENTLCTVALEKRFAQCSVKYFEHHLTYQNFDFEWQQVSFQQISSFAQLSFAQPVELFVEKFEWRLSDFVRLRFSDFVRFQLKLFLLRLVPLPVPAACCLVHLKSRGRMQRRFNRQFPP